MAFEQKNMTGALFKRDKQGNDKRPDYGGTCVINGEVFEIAAWLKKSQKGVAFMSLSFQTPRAPEADKY